MKVKVPPVWSTSARDGWLPNQFLEQLKAVPELLSAVISDWLVRLWWYFGCGLFLQKCLLCPGYGMKGIDLATLALRVPFKAGNPSLDA